MFESPAIRRDNPPQILADYRTLDGVLKPLLFFNNDRPCGTFGGSLPNPFLKMLRNVINNDSCLELIFIVIEDFRTKFVTVAIPHA
jgi:hypothetical protein